jgi:dipeptidyl-peptidase-4
MLNPNGNRELINYMRDELMPTVGNTLRDTYDVQNCFYGVFRDPTDFDKGWFPYACEPRYISNYYGIRNRLGILNENYVYADYKSRVQGCYYLIRSLMDYASLHSSEIGDMIERVDSETINRGLSPAVTDSFAIAYIPKPTPEKVTIKAYEVEIIETQSGRRRMAKTDRKVTVTVPYLADYYPTSNVKFPFAYIIQFPDPDVLSVLKKHGIQVEQLEKKTSIEVEQFVIEEITPSSRMNQGHYTNKISGKFESIQKEFPKGTIVVRTAQSLGSLIAYLLEPQADDGLLFWNYFDRYLSPQWGRGFNPYPVYKVLDKTDLQTAGR